MKNSSGGSGGGGSTTVVVQPSQPVVVGAGYGGGGYSGRSGYSGGEMALGIYTFYIHDSIKELYMQDFEVYITINGYLLVLELIIIKEKRF